MEKWKLGVIVHMSEQIEAEIHRVRSLGFDTCQLACWDESLMTDNMVQKIRHAVDSSGMQITAFWCGWPGPAVWNFIEGPQTLGLVPSAYRFARMIALQKGSDFSKRIGVKHLVTHLGFIPENASDPLYAELLSAARSLCAYCERNEQQFLFETGQETPVTLKRFLDDVGYHNVGVNFDPANLLMYGKANPIDALDILGPYVQGVHAKDGEYPTTGKHLGEEKPIGEGKVNFRKLFAKLSHHHYTGAITIEREISGEQQLKDIAASKLFLQQIIHEEG